jgi:hypothetical protein
MGRSVAPGREHGLLKELRRTTDPVFVSMAQAALAAQGIEAVVFDAATSAAEGGIGAFPRRIMVTEEDFAAAERLLGALEQEFAADR